VTGREENGTNPVRTAREKGSFSVIQSAPRSHFPQVALTGGVAGVKVRSLCPKKPPDKKKIDGNLSRAVLGKTEKKKQNPTNQKSQKKGPPRKKPGPDLRNYCRVPGGSQVKRVSPKTAKKCETSKVKGGPKLLLGGNGLLQIKNKNTWGPGQGGLTVKIGSCEGMLWGKKLQ